MRWRAQAGTASSKRDREKKHFECESGCFGDSQCDRAGGSTQEVRQRFRCYTAGTPRQTERPIERDAHPGDRRDARNQQRGCVTEHDGARVEGRYPAKARFVAFHEDRDENASAKGAREARTPVSDPLRLVREELDARDTSEDDGEYERNNRSKAGDKRRHHCLVVRVAQRAAQQTDVRGELGAGIAERRGEQDGCEPAPDTDDREAHSSLIMQDIGPERKSSPDGIGGDCAAGDRRAGA